MPVDESIADQLTGAITTAQPTGTTTGVAVRTASAETTAALSGRLKGTNSIKKVAKIKGASPSAYSLM